MTLLSHSSLDNKLRIPVMLVVWIADQTGTDGVKHFPHTVFRGQAGLEAQFLLNFFI
jgi:hypothetical protein